ncbi:MAG: S9 family peptidase [Gemmatimonadaceae bacterium]|nr:S9 family peptidase [Gemmatimonadaceae bacterium]
MLRLVAICLLLVAPVCLPAQSTRRPLRLDDLFRIKSVRDPQVSPDGQWVAYVVSQLDSTRDKSNADIWMVSWDGTRTVQLTHTPEGESAPRWSPDNRYLAFAASRGDSKAGSQVWVLDRLGGEARQLTRHKGGVSSYAWSPDASRLLFIAQDPDSAELADSAKKSTPRPIVVDRYAFKRDGEGYLSNRRAHIYVHDIAKDTTIQVTSGPYDDNAPTWSPDGRSIAFVSERGKDPDRDNNSDVFVVEARAGGTVRQLTTFPGPDTGPLAFSPDGAWIAYSQGNEARLYAYSMDHLAVVASSGGTPRVLTAALDRSVGDPVWSADGRSITVLLEDDRAVHVARVDVASAQLERVLQGRRVVQELAEGPGGKLAVLAGTADRPSEIHVLESGALRPLTHANDAWAAEVRLSTVEDVSAKGKDGTVVNGLLARPADAPPGRRMPTLLRIHGGPASQDQHAFSFEREFFAANGYAVLNVNYRGSTGRGSAHQQAIYADWGNKEVQDLLAAVDHVVATGVADPDRLGIGGWSYGGILTNYTIATDTRFKAAISGAGSSMQLTMYGTDQYIYQYETELGAPWRNPRAWEKVSYPFFKADRITTPTLFMGGKDDDNVPITGSEQMYQALKSLGVETQLVVYPGQNHGISLPSFQKDRLARYLAWYDAHLKHRT